LPLVPLTSPIRQQPALKNGSYHDPTKPVAVRPFEQYPNPLRAPPRVSPEPWPPRLTHACHTVPFPISLSLSPPSALPTTAIFFTGIRILYGFARIAAPEPIFTRSFLRSSFSGHSLPLYSPVTKGKPSLPPPAFYVAHSPQPPCSPFFTGHALVFSDPRPTPPSYRQPPPPPSTPFGTFPRPWPVLTVVCPPGGAFTCVPFPLWGIPICSAPPPPPVPFERPFHSEGCPCFLGLHVVSLQPTTLPFATGDDTPMLLACSITQFPSFSFLSWVVCLAGDWWGTAPCSSSCGLCPVPPFASPLFNRLFFF